MTLEVELNKLNDLISNKEQDLKNVESEISKLKHTRYELEFKIGKQKCIKYIEDFINQNGNVLNRNLHDELRLNLIKLLYKEENYISSYDRVLHLILDKIGVKHRYLAEKDDNTKWSLLEIQLIKGNDK